MYNRYIEYIDYMGYIGYIEYIEYMGYIIYIINIMIYQNIFGYIIYIFEYIWIHQDIFGCFRIYKVSMGYIKTYQDIICYIRI